jgi:hypothetical protein
MLYMRRAVRTWSLLLTIAAPAAAAPKPVAPNALTRAEKAAGWMLLFDGRTAQRWRGLRLETFPEGWAAADGTIMRVRKQGEPGGRSAGDLITREQFDNFDFKVEWRLTQGGNSGIKYLLDTSHADKGFQGWGVGFEYQMIDDHNHPEIRDKKILKHATGALYDILEPLRAQVVLNKAGEWNETRILVDGNHVEHWLNGRKVLEFERGSPALEAAIAQSKFKDRPGFGENARGHILLQDHTDGVWFRNIKLKRLPARRASR